MRLYYDNQNGKQIQSAELGADLWDALVDLYREWINVVNAHNHNTTAAVEQELRFFTLTYASLKIDVINVTTGRKAVLRSMYHELHNADRDHVIAMLDCVIAREELAARRLEESAADS